MSWVFAIACFLLFLRLTLPHLSTLGRWGLLSLAVVGFVAGSLRDLATGDIDDAPLHVGLALILLAAVVSTAGKPYLLIPGEMRDPPVEERRRTVVLRQSIFGIVMVALLAPYAWYLS